MVSHELIQIAFSRFHEDQHGTGQPVDAANLDDVIVLERLYMNEHVDFDLLSRILVEWYLFHSQPGDARVPPVPSYVL